MLDDELTLLDGTEVVSTRGVAKITNDPVATLDLVLRARHEATLGDEPYYNRADIARLIAAAR